MQFLSGGYYKPTIHRVIQPPQDQAQLERLGVFYFAMTSDFTKLTAHENSPVLKREGISTGVNTVSDAPTMAEWRKERTAKYGKTKRMKSKDADNVEEHIVLGKVVKEYN